MKLHSQNSAPNALKPLIEKAQSGDQAAFEELLNRYTPLIDSMTEHFGGSSRPPQDKEDLRQEAIFCFYRALMHFDTAQEQVQFGFYAKECIKNGLISSLRALKKHEHVLLLADESASLAEAGDAEDPSRHIVETESYLEISRRICEVLSEYENRIWWLYLSGRTAKEIAVLTDRDEKSVQNAIYRIRKKLRAVIPYA